jgi:N-acetylglucosaminyldiphosphoundecaprenol N-acetyl-beta-D-mannosaminyltransferase
MYGTEQPRRVRGGKPSPAGEQRVGCRSASSLKVILNVEILILGEPVLKNFGEQVAKRDLATLPIALMRPGEAARWICRQALRPDSQGIDIHLLNAYSIALSHSDPKFRQTLSRAHLNLPDGKPLAWVTRFSRRPLHQVRGPQLFNDVMNLGRQTDVQHFLLGSSEETLTLLAAELRRRYPGVSIAGTYSPPFRVLTAADLRLQDQAILASGAQVIWVGLGTPKQDFEAQRIASAMPVISVAVGAAFDFVAGSKPEAPIWMTRVGLEWIFRFATEPRRLWRRYLIGNFVFLKAVWVGRTTE